MNRRHITFLDIVFKAAMAVAIFAMVSYLSIRHYRTFDFTASGLYSLSPKSKKVIDVVNREVIVKVFFQDIHQVYDDLKTILDLYAQASSNIKIQYIDPDKDIAKFKQISSKYKIDTMAVVIVESGDNIKYLQEEDLVHIVKGDVKGHQTPYIAGLKIESAVTAAILNVINPNKKKIYFSTGHGEKDITNEDFGGLAEFVDLLKRDNYAVEPLSLLGVETIPKDCSLLFFAGASVDYTEKELFLINSYLSRGGAVFIALDPLSKTNLNDAVKPYGLSIGNNIVVDPAKRVQGRSPANLYIDTYGDHIITEMLSNVAVLLYLASSVDILEEVNQDTLDISQLLFTSEYGWGEVDTALNTFALDREKDLTGPVSVAAVVEEKKQGGCKIALFGDADFMLTENITVVGNSDILMNTVNWLTDSDSLISIAVKPKEKVFLSLKAAELNKILFMVLCFIPGVFILAAVIVWFKRRK